MFGVQCLYFRRFETGWTMKNLAFAWHVVGRWTGWLPANPQHEPTENPWGFR